MFGIVDVILFGSNVVYFGKNRRPNENDHCPCLFLQQDIGHCKGRQTLIFMKSKCFFLLATAYLFALGACNPSRCDECADADYKHILFFSKTDSTDLISSGQYLLDSLRITPILIDTSLAGAIIRIDIAYQNAFISASKNTSGYIIQLDSLPPDTLLVTTMPSQGDGCCPRITEFDKLLLNGDSIFNDYSVVAIKIYK
jgi:hypothetical protein